MKTKQRKKPSKKSAFVGDVFAWCERHDQHPAEGWLYLVLDGTYSLEEMREAILADRVPKESDARKIGTPSGVVLEEA